jgi:thiamine pyrophosphate-dependent acetolactate synthase large subunit-like protein
VALAQAAAERPRRVVTVAGDAAFAETVNAIGLGAQLGQDNVIFVMDNRVYAVEQWLIDAGAFAPGAPPPEFAALTDVPQGRIWDYVKIAEGFGGVGHAVSTKTELRAVLEGLSERPINPVTGAPTFTLVAVRVPAKDYPDTVGWKVRAAGA